MRTARFPVGAVKIQPRFHPGAVVQIIPGGSRYSGKRGVVVDKRSKWPDLVCVNLRVGKKKAAVELWFSRDELTVVSAVDVLAELATTTGGGV